MRQCTKMVPKRRHWLLTGLFNHAKGVFEDKRRFITSPRRESWILAWRNGMTENNGAPGSGSILVVGGGISGLTAALEAAEVGYEVFLVEKKA